MDDLILGSLKPYQLKKIEEMRAQMGDKERLSRKQDAARERQQQQQRSHR